MGRRALLLGVVVAAIVCGSAGARPADAPPTSQISAIAADFRQADFATYYTIDVTPAAGRKVQYRWVLTSLKADPGCNKFHVSATNENQAVWNHGDEDGCDHAKMDSRGHVGTVEVVVHDGVYKCTALYVGTISGTGPKPTCKTWAGINAADFVESAISHLSDAAEGKQGHLKTSQHFIDRAIGELEKLDADAARSVIARLRRASALADASHYKLAREQLDHALAGARNLP